MDKPRRSRRRDAQRQYYTNTKVITEHITQTEAWHSICFQDRRPSPQSRVMYQLSSPRTKYRKKTHDVGSYRMTRVYQRYPPGFTSSAQMARDAGSVCMRWKMLRVDIVAYCNTPASNTTLDLGNTGDSRSK